uniref:FinTRIM family, member 14-like n=1 Tax=Sinocyclocheilus anshuiensis TaxID=1608454 RepID=A0A671TFF4_9TELE
MSRGSTANQSRYSTLEKPRRSGRYSSSSSWNSSREVLCDFCLAKKNKAVKSCLTCLTSFCETHLQAHYEYPALMKHKLICAEHDKLLEVFCRSDLACVCVLCIMEEHKKHDIVSAAAERTEKQVSLSAERTLTAMKNHSSQNVLDENERIFAELLQALERRHEEVKEMIRAQETLLLTRAEGHLARLKEEITLLRKKHRQADLEQLSQSDDHIHFLQVLLKTQSFYINTFFMLINLITPLLNLDSCQFSMDPSTAHPNLHLSDRNTVVRMSNEPKSYPEHPDHFEYWQQVLCKEGLAGGRYYWEVDWSGTEIDIAVTYRGIQRKGNDNAGSFGGNDKSWSLCCSESKYYFVHNSKRTTILPVPSSSRIGVYVDYEAGTVAFYSVSDTMKLLHKVQAKFTEPLYPGLGVWGYGTTVCLIGIGAGPEMGVR